MERRLDRLFSWMRKHQIDATWITSTENVYYFTGCYIEPHERTFGLFLFSQGDAILVFPKLEQETVQLAAWKHLTISYDDAQDPWELFRSRFQKDLQQVKRVAFEQDSITYSKFFQFISMLLPLHVDWVGIDQELHRMRMIKDLSERELIQEAAKLADDAMQIAVESLSEGCTELEVAANIEYAMKKRGVHQMAFDTLVLFGHKTALPHGLPDQTTLQSGDLILIDLGVRFNGYCSDLTRTFAFQATKGIQIEMIETVLRAQQAAIRACTPETRIDRIDQVARSIITEAGYGEYFLHRTGHGLGLGIHEFPSISGNNRDLLQPGMVLTIEPGIYIPNVGGVRIEDDLLITEEGSQLLTHFPRELQVLT